MLTATVPFAAVIINYAVDQELKGDSPSAAAAAGPHSPLLPYKYMGSPLLYLTATTSQEPHQMALQEVRNPIISCTESSCCSQHSCASSHQP